MHLAQWLAFSAVVFVITYCPGPMTLFCMSTGIDVGPQRTGFAVLGGSTAYLVQLTIVALGLEWIIQASPFAFILIKWLGALYLLYLGLKQWFRKPLQLNSASRIENNISCWYLYRRGFLVGITNPKSMLTFTALFPHFLSHPSQPTLQFAILGATFLVFQFSSASSYALFGAGFYRWLKRKNFLKLQDYIISVILILIALSLLLVKSI